MEAIDEPKEEDGLNGGIGDSSEKANDQFKAWRKKNVKALRAIQISCGFEAISKVKDTSSTKIA